MVEATSLTWEEFTGLPQCTRGSVDRHGGPLRLGGSPVARGSGKVGEETLKVRVNYGEPASGGRAVLAEEITVLDVQPEVGCLR